MAHKKTIRKNRKKTNRKPRIRNPTPNSIVKGITKA